MGELKDIKEERFCQEYLKDGNATAAYIRAGYTGIRSTAAQNGYKKLKKAHIQGRLMELRAIESGKNADLNRWIRDQWKTIAETEVTDGLQWVQIPADDGGGGRFVLRPIEDLPTNLRTAMQKVRQTPQGIEYELCSKERALENLMRIQGLCGEINMAIAIFRRYGVHIYFENGRWQIDDGQSFLFSKNDEQESMGGEEETGDIA